MPLLHQSDGSIAPHQPASLLSSSPRHLCCFSLRKGVFIEKPGYCLPSCMLPPHLLSLSTRLPIVPRVCDAGSLPDSSCLLIVVCALVGRHACRYRRPESDSRVSCYIHRLHLPFKKNFFLYSLPPTHLFSLLSETGTGCGWLVP